MRQLEVETVLVQLGIDPKAYANWAEGQEAVGGSECLPTNKYLELDEVDDGAAESFGTGLLTRWRREKPEAR